MSTTKPISLRSTLIGESVAFLDKEAMQCLTTQKGIVELVNQLVNYKEEGKLLFPEVYIIDDVELVMQILPMSQHCFIGSGDKSEATMLKALKKCAPLTENEWSIYIQRNAESFDYGVFRAGTSLLSVSIEETLIDNGTDEVKAILIRQVSDKLIEVKGVQSDSLLISFGGREEANGSPIDNQAEFIKSIVKNVAPEVLEPTTNFYTKLFNDVLKVGHGTLACVINHKKKSIPVKLSDGITLRDRINIPNLIGDLLAMGDLVTNSKLNGYYTIISGMLQSDGITIFTDQGEVASYNVFVKHPSKIAKTNTSGGARSRTFLTLSDMIGKGIVAAYIQSQDGKIEFKNNE